jgi:hypothetical protein
MRHTFFFIDVSIARTCRSIIASFQFLRLFKAQEVTVSVTTTVIDLVCIKEVCLCCTGVPCNRAILRRDSAVMKGDEEEEWD